MKPSVAVKTPEMHWDQTTDPIAKKITLAIKGVKFEVVFSGQIWIDRRIDKRSPSPIVEVRHQLLLGDDAFVRRHKPALAKEQLWEVSKTHRRSIAIPLAKYQTHYSDRDEAMARAYLSGAYTMAMIAEHFGVHYMIVSRAVRKIERNKR